MVITHRHQHATQRRRPRHIGVTEDITRPVYTRSFAVPETEDAVILALATQFGLLSAPKGRGGKILIQSGMELDMRRLGKLMRGLKGRIDCAQRRAAITGNITCRVVPRVFIARTLHQCCPDQRLSATEQHSRAIQIVPVG